MSIEVKKNFQISPDSNILKPDDEQNVSEIIRQTYKKNLPIEIIGSNSKKFIGYNLQTAKTLDISNLSGIVEYLPEELYIKVKAGTPLSLIEETLDKNNQQLAFEPIDFGFIQNGKSNKGTIGGYVSCNFAGSRRFKLGSVRDHILGFRGVNGKGDIIKSGGTVVKNVTGYDLSKLVTGSFGTLTALTEITFKVLPKKDSISTLVIYLEDNKIISNLFDQLLSSSNEISGSVYIPNEPKNNNYTINREKILKFNDLKSELKSLVNSLGPSDDIEINSRIFSFPTVYLDKWTKECVEDYSSKIAKKKPDPELITELNNLESTEQFVRVHSGTEYWVSAIGFWPGLPFMMALDPRCKLTVPKYNPPRTWTPKGTVGMGGASTSIYPDRLPGGYQIFGIIPVPIWDTKKSFPVFENNICLFQPGDRVKFVPTTYEEFDHVSKKVEDGTYDYNIIEYQKFSVKNYKKWLTTIDQTKRF